MAGYIIDASVLVEIFVGGQDRENCMRFLEKAAEEVWELHAPDALYYEVAGALSRYERRSDYATMEEDIADLSDLDLQTVPARELLLPAVEIARTHQISMYDSFYLALSKQLELTLVTVDGRLVRAVEGKPFRVVHVRDVGT